MTPELHIRLTRDRLACGPLPDVVGPPVEAIWAPPTCAACVSAMQQRGYHSGAGGVLIVRRTT